MSQVSRAIMPPVVLLDNVAATGIGNIMDLRDYLYVQVVISTSGNADGTIRFRGSMQSPADVDLSAAASISNEWDTIASYNLQNPTTVIAGDTGVVYSGTDAVEQMIINIDAVSAFTVHLTRNAGTFRVTVYGYTNQ